MVGQQRRPGRNAIALAAALLIAAGAIPSAQAMGAQATVVLHVRSTHAAGTTWAWAAVGTGKPLLLLNGTGSPMNEWDPALLKRLAAERRVIVFDYPGLGRSGPAPDRWTFAHAADWVADFIKAIAPGRNIDVLGWSMGGFIAQQLAVRHPDSVRGLVLAGTNPGGSHAELGPAWVQEADSDPHAGDATYLRTNYPSTPQAQAAGRAFLDRLQRALRTGAYPPEHVPARTVNAMVAAEDPWLRSEGNLRALPSLRHPTLVITGAQDVITPASNSRVIASAITGARLMLVKGAGHSFLFQQPRRTAGVVLDFLQESPGSAE